MLNQAMELESIDGSSNDTTAEAQDISASFINLGAEGVERGAVSGTVNGGFIYTTQRSDNVLRKMDANGKTLSTVDLGTSSRGLALDPQTGTLYGVLNSGDLATINPDTGETTALGNLEAEEGHRFGEIAFDDSGNLYGITGGRSNDPNTLYAIDLSDPTRPEPLYSFGSNFENTGAGGFAFNPDSGLFYRFQRGIFESIDLSTPIPTVTEIPITVDAGGGEDEEFEDFTNQSMTYLGGGEFLVHSIAGLLTLDVSGNLARGGELDHHNTPHGMAFAAGEETDDLFAFQLEDGDTVAFAVDGNVQVTLLDPAGSEVTTMAFSVTNADFVHTSTTVSDGGLYYAKVSSDSFIDYNLVITKNASFDGEIILETPSTNPAVLAQPLFDATAALGHVSGVDLLLASNERNELLTIDPTVGTLSSILASNLDSGFNDIAQNPLTGVFFGTENSGGRGLFRIDPISGTVTRTADIEEQLFAIEFAPDGSELYAASRDEFGRIGIQEEIFIPIASLPERLGGIAFQPGTGTLFGVSNREPILYTIDPATGATTEVGSTDVPLNSLEFLADGTLVAGGIDGDGKLYEVDPATGATTLIGDPLAETDGDNLIGLANLLSEPDYYSFEATVGDTFELFTTTPADGVGEFGNTLDPIIELIDPNGDVVAMDDNGDADGRNAKLTHTVAEAGTFVVVVKGAVGTEGEYVLHRSAQTIDPPAVSNPTGIDVQNGETQRSFVNSVDILFDGSDGLQDIIDASGITVEQFGINSPHATPGTGTAIGAGIATVNGDSINLDFGANGIGGVGAAGNGFYRVSIDTDGDGSADVSFEFFRLYGDGNGDGVVSRADGAARVDLNGDGRYDIFDMFAIRTENGKAVDLALLAMIDD